MPTTSQVIVGGGVVSNAFSYASTGGGTLTVGTAAYPVQILTFLSATAIIKMGAAPLATGAINIDGASYANLAFTAVSGTETVAIYVGSASFGRAIGTTSAHTFNLFANNQAKWFIATTALESLLGASQATARIRGGSSNGLAIQNSGGTRDNFLVADSGSQWTLDNGTDSAVCVASGVSGERNRGGHFIANGSSQSATIETLNSGTTSAIQGIYFDGTQRRSAWEITNVASGFGTFALMKSGGNIAVGGTAVGATSNGVLGFAINATEPTASVDLVHIYGFDRAAGARAFAVYQEAATQAVGGAATDEWPVRINGTNYMVQLRAA